MKTKIFIYSILFFIFSIQTLLFSAEDFVWVKKTSMHSARSETSAVCFNEKIYVFGGRDETDTYDENAIAPNTFEIYDPQTNTWTIKDAFSTARRTMCTAIINDKIYIIGGGAAAHTEYDLVEEYDPINDIWSIKTPMPTARFGVGIGAVNNKIYVIGGYSHTLELEKELTEKRALDIVEEYDPQADTWTTKRSMPTQRHSVASVVVDNKIYIIGGYNHSPDHMTLLGVKLDIEVYDPLTDTWDTTRKDMPNIRVGCFAATFNNKIYLYGGFSSTGDLSTVEEYDITNDIWTTKRDMITSRNFFAIAALNDSVYILGGNQTKTNYLSTVEEGEIQSLQVLDKLESAYCYPSPCKFGADDVIKFKNFTPYAIVNIVSPAGHIVKTFNADMYGEILPWNGKNDADEKIGSGTYIVHAKDPNREVKKFNIVIIQ